MRNNFVLFLEKIVEIKFSCQDLGKQIKTDVPVKDAKTRANKTEEINKQENCKISQACSTKKIYIYIYFS